MELRNCLHIDFHPPAHCHSDNLSVFSSHPLAGYQKPKLAAASYFYELWSDVVPGGRYTSQIKYLHELYYMALLTILHIRVLRFNLKLSQGHVLRINLDEVHCNDPEYMHILHFRGKAKRNKFSYYLPALPWGHVWLTIAFCWHLLIFVVFM